MSGWSGVWRCVHAVIVQSLRDLIKHALVAGECWQPGCGLSAFITTSTDLLGRQARLTIEDEVRTVTLAPRCTWR